MEKPSEFMGEKKVESLIRNQLTSFNWVDFSFCNKQTNTTEKIACVMLILVGLQNVNEIAKSLVANVLVMMLCVFGAHSVKRHFVSIPKLLAVNGNRGRMANGNCRENKRNRPEMRCSFWLTLFHGRVPLSATSYLQATS